MGYVFTSCITKSRAARTWTCTWTSSPWYTWSGVSTITVLGYLYRYTYHIRSYKCYLNSWRSKTFSENRTGDFGMCQKGRIEHRYILIEFKFFYYSYNFCVSFGSISRFNMGSIALCWWAFLLCVCLCVSHTMVHFHYFFYIYKYMFYGLSSNSHINVIY